MGATSVDTVENRVRSIAQEVVAEPLYLVDVVVRGQKGSRVIEIYVDSDDVLSVEQLAEMSREIGFLLESEDVVPGRYNLNVSSPGVDRPLMSPRQLRKNVGRDVSVSFKDGRKQVRGTLADVDEDSFTIRAQNKVDNRLSFGEVEEVRVLLPW
ncbi:MAG: ribosome maturation factor RimP [Rhodothermia bacterium]|nr:ribosome maturation factor RimP [Rhodothermia bacterium]